MKKRTFLTPASGVALLLGLLSLTATAQTSATTEKRDVTGFSSVQISGAYQVTLEQGAGEGIEITGDADEVAAVITKVQSGTLKIHQKEGHHSSKSVKITLRFKALTGIDCSGASTLKSNGALSFDKLEMNNSGATAADLELSAVKLDIDISGSGSVKLKGKSGKLDLDISGSGSCKAADFETENSEVNISGAGVAEVSVSAKLNVSISGSGVVKYKGEPQVSRAISGSGKVEKM